MIKTASSSQGAKNLLGRGEMVVLVTTSSGQFVAFKSGSSADQILSAALPNATRKNYGDMVFILYFGDTGQLENLLAEVA